MQNSTYVSFYLSSNTIHIFRTTVRFLGDPPFLQFLFHTNGRSMIMQPCEERSFTTVRVPKSLYSGHGKTQAYSKGLCRLLAKKLNWDINYSYRIPGKMIPQQRIVMFDFSEATVISQGGSYNPDLYLRNE